MSVENQKLDHSHCFDCIKWIKCLDKKSSQPHCPIVACELNCGAKFHWCKNDEHLLLCPEVRVPCLNAQHGCTSMLIRRKMSYHLVHCPASVVHCSVEWNRWPLQSTSRTLDHLSNALHIRTPVNNHNQENANDEHVSNVPNDLILNDKSDRSNQSCLPISLDAAALKAYHLDVALTLRDQRLIRELIHLKQNIQCLTCNSLTRLNPTLPVKAYFPEAIDDTQQCFNQLPFINHNSNIDFDSQLILDLNFDAIAPFQPKPKQMFTFKCAQNFRRDEYAAHYHNVHSDIMGSMNGWMERRCPKWQYGCPATFTSIIPYPVPSQIVFNTMLESFGHLIACTDVNLCKDQSEHEYLKSDDCQLSKDSFSLMSLPPEILEIILSKLDGFTLNNVSITCKTLRTIVSKLLNTNGLVTLIWKRNPLPTTNGDVQSTSGGWQVVGFRRYFSNSMHEIHRWKLFDHGQMLNHMKQCTYGNVIRNKEPVYLRGIGSTLYSEINKDKLDTIV